MEQLGLDNLKTQYQDILEEYFDKVEGHKYNNGEGYDDALSNWYYDLTEGELNYIVSMPTINKLK